MRMLQNIQIDQDPPINHIQVFNRLVFVGCQRHGHNLHQLQKNITEPVS